jgi:integrase
VKTHQSSCRPLQKISGWHLKASGDILPKHRICAGLFVGGARNLGSATETKTVAGKIKDPSTKGRILEYLVHLNNEAKKPDTLRAHRKILTRLAKHGANLLDPESAKQTIASEKVQDSTKALYVGVYKVFADYCGLSWKPPTYKYTRKLPFIPLESEIDQLIAGFKKRTATFLKVLKETGARCGEAWALKWTDLNGNILTINAPEKGSLPRQHKISEKLESMLQNLPKKDPRIFGPYMSLSNFRSGFMRKRRSISRNLSNPRLDEITFHTFRHFFATMLYAKTKNIILVQQKLGHKSIENTQIYTQLIVFESDDYHSATATRTDEAEKLVQAGFEYVCTTTENIMLFRKRK